MGVSSLLHFNSSQLPVAERGGHSGEMVLVANPTPEFSHGLSRPAWIQPSDSARFGACDVHHDFFLSLQQCSRKKYISSRQFPSSVYAQ